MKKIIFLVILLVALAAGGAAYWFKFPPEGYAGALNEVTHPGISDPAKSAASIAHWTLSWRRSLGYFERELDSRDPVHAEAGLGCIGMLTYAMEISAYSEDEKNRFRAALPAQKIREMVVKHPEMRKRLPDLLAKTPSGKILGLTALPEDQSRK